MIDDQEITAILAAYRALKGFSRPEWSRALEYIGARLAGDDRTGFLMAGEGFPQPMQWVIAGELDTARDDPTDVALDSLSESWAPIEVNGIAVVSQRFAVIVPAEDGGQHLEWFDTLDAADAFIAEAFAPVVPAEAPL